MKISKRQLKRIIAEEKQKITEMRGRHMADHFEGIYTPVAMAEQFENLADRLFGEIFDAAVSDGIEDEEAAEGAAQVLNKILARSLNNYV